MANEPTHRCPKCGWVFTGPHIADALEVHDERHKRFEQFGTRRNQWTRHDKLMLERFYIKFPGDEAA